jgi:hypothetical protein
MNTTEADVRSNNKVHGPYKREGGSRVPSVTTIIGGVLAKPALIKWAHGLGLKGIDMDSYRDELADIGKLAHRMILDHLRGEKTDTTHYSPAQVDLAENAFIKYLEWEKGHRVEPVLIEQPLVSELHGFGGTPDFYGKVDGVWTIIDYKTGKGIYFEYWLQLAAYRELIEETMGAEATTTFRVLNIGRNETEQFVEEVKTDLGVYWSIFWHTLRIYDLKKGMDK